MDTSATTGEQVIQPVKSPYKQMKNSSPAKNPRRTRSSQFPSRNTTTTTTTAARGKGGIFLGPLPYPPPASSLYWSYPPTSTPHQPPPPPLLPLPLPLPISNPYFYPLQSHRNITGTKLLSTSQPNTTTRKPAAKKPHKKTTKTDDPKAVFVSKISPSGPHPNYNDMLAISPPPPSSLPLPKFFLRPKANIISCTAEAGGVDTGATDNLCRMLRLR